MYSTRRLAWDEVQAIFCVVSSPLGNIDLSSIVRTPRSFIHVSIWPLFFSINCINEATLINCINEAAVALQNGRPNYRVKEDEVKRRFAVFGDLFHDPKHPVRESRTKAYGAGNPQIHPSIVGMSPAFWAYTDPRNGDADGRR
jgi:hypothetical protein